MSAGLPQWHGGKESASQCRRHGRSRFNPWVGKIPRRRKWQPTPVFLPRKYHGQRSLGGHKTTTLMFRHTKHARMCQLLAITVLWGVCSVFPCTHSQLLLLLSRFSHVWLCDPIDGSPRGSPIPGILQAGTLEWVAISLHIPRGLHNSYQNWPSIHFCWIDEHALCWIHKLSVLSFLL